MSSATPRYPDAFRVGMQQIDRVLAKVQREGMTSRQAELNGYWAYYCAQQYDHCRVDWSGREVVSEAQRESISRSAVIPPGFYNARAFEDLPLDYRRPRAAYPLVRVIVNRFTDILFSEDARPKFVVKGNPEVQSLVEYVTTSAHLWINMQQARNFGGGQGSVMVTFRFSGGVPIVEAHDARWCDPVFEDAATGELRSVRIQYMYCADERRPDGTIDEVWYWYRRDIDQVHDVLYAPAVVDEDPPEWVIQQDVAHDLGEFPGVWIRNTKTSETDGEPDCYGVFDLTRAVDMLYSQAEHGALENADPTLHMALDEMNDGKKGVDGSLKKGSHNSIATNEKGKIAYVEMTGSGVTTAMSVASARKAQALEVTQCVLDSSDDVMKQMTATEVARRARGFYSRGSTLRELYGSMGVVVLVQKMLRTIVRLAQGQVVGGEVVRRTFAIPAGLQEVAARGVEFSETSVTLSWPPFVQMGPADAQQAAQGAAVARTAGLLDLDTAVAYLAPYFGTSDAAAAVASLKAEEAQKQAQFTQPGVDMNQAGTAGQPEQQPQQFPTVHQGPPIR